MAEYPDEYVVKTAEGLGVPLVRKDITTISKEELQQILTETGVDAVIALRTPAKIAEQILHVLDEIGFSGNFIFSVIEQGDDLPTIRNLQSDIKKRGAKEVMLENWRMITEHGFAVTFPRQS